MSSSDRSTEGSTETKFDPTEGLKGRHIDDLPHLLIDTHMGVNHRLPANLKQVHIDATADRYPHDDDRSSTIKSTQDGNDDLASSHSVANEQHHHFRKRAVTDLTDLHPAPAAIGIRIPNRQQPQPTIDPFGQLSPPLSLSPSLLDSYNPYSTSAHLFSQHSPTKLPDTPETSALPPIIKHTQTMFSALPSRSYIHDIADMRSPLRPVSRSVSLTSYNRSVPRQTYVDASSYESVPDSPAKLWLQGFAQKTAPVASPDDEGQEIGHYTIGRQLGVGGFSVVKEAFTIENGKQKCYAVKIVRKCATTDDAGNENVQSHFEHEIGVWRCLNSRYILPLLEKVETSYATWAFTLLFSGGTLFDAFKVYRQGLPPAASLKYAFQLASALRYLHQDARVVHRDVKLENCVLDRPLEEGGDLRLCDFGLADFLPGDDTPSPKQEFTTPHGGDMKPHLRPEDMVAGGSLAYAAPEQIRSTVPLLDTAIDMWSFGVVVHAIVVGELPFFDPFPPKLQDLILSDTWNKERFVNRVDPEVCEVVLSCLEKEPARRWTAVEALAGSWLSTYTDLESEERHYRNGLDL